ncbi:MAG: c-type cytochrome [Gallionella sp.]
MTFAKVLVITSLSTLLLAASAAFADDSPESIKIRMGAGDPVAGKEKSALCQGCHGEDGNSTSADYPKLAGQFASYIQKQIRDFKAGVRKDPVMSEMAASVTEEQDLLDISAYFASQNQMMAAKRVTNKNGKARFLEAGNSCVNCHGEEGKGKSPKDAPVIGGQHREYIVKQLKAFRSGERTNDSSGMMAIVASGMEDDQMEEVAIYISGRK